MVRPSFGPPRFKSSRPYNNGPMFTSRQEQHHLKTRRDAQDYTGKAPRSWRGARGRGRPPFTKRALPLMGERREPPQNRNSFQSYSQQMEPHHRPSRPPHSQRRLAPHGPPHGSPSHRGPAYREAPSDAGQRSPSPWHHHKSPADRRQMTSPPYRGSYRGPNRQPGAPREERRNQDPRGHYSPRERPYEHPAHGAKRWSSDAEYSHQHNGEYGPSGSQMKPREFHRRNYPERWSGEQDSRRPRGQLDRDGIRSQSLEKAQESHSHLPPYRPPAWKDTPSSSSPFHGSPRERQMPIPRKRRLPDFGMPFAGAPPEHSHPKQPRRGRPYLVNAPSGFGCRLLSLVDRRTTFQGRSMRVQPALRMGAPLNPKPVAGLSTSRASSILALRKKRFQSNAAPLRNLELRRIKPRQSPTGTEGEANKSPKECDTVKEKVESRRSISTRSTSPIDKHLTSDLVVVSHWQAGPSTSSKDCAPPRDRSPASKNEQNSDSEVGSCKRFSKLHGSRPPPDNRRDSYPEKRPVRPFLLESPRYGRPFRRPGPAPPQRPPFSHGPRRNSPEPPVRKPLMETFVPRPFPQQKPVFRKSQSIRSKYRNMQVLRHRGPSQQQW